MWTRVLRETYVALTAVTPAAALRHAGLLLSLLENLENLQSEPAAFLEVVHRSLDESGLGSSAPAFLSELAARVEGPLPLGPGEWLMLVALGELTELVESGWEPFYHPISDGEADLASKLQALRAALRLVPLETALRKLAREWRISKDRILNRVAIAFIRVCAMLEILDVTGDIYRQVAILLSFEGDFLSVWIAGACLKVKAIAGSIDLSELSEEQYSCMRMLDQFSSLQGIPWG